MEIEICNIINVFILIIILNMETFFVSNDNVLFIYIFIVIQNDLHLANLVRDNQSINNIDLKKQLSALWAI